MERIMVFNRGMGIGYIDGVIGFGFVYFGVV